jgi:hypothetical protein
MIDCERLSTDGPHVLEVTTGENQTSDEQLPDGHTILSITHQMKLDIDVLAALCEKILASFCNYQLHVVANRSFPR